MTKKHHDLFEKVTDFQNIKSSYFNVLKDSKKYKKEAILFDMCREKHLIDIWKDLRSGQYKVGEYIRFKVYEPKERMISAPKIRDKVVQFAVHNVLSQVYRPIFIKTSFACQVGKGTHAAVDHVQHFLRLCKWRYKTGWILKIDVKKFFYSIDRSILKEILRKKIVDPDMLKLLDDIIDSSPEGEVGIPLGNVTSQDFANIYLNELDQYCVRYLGVKWYARYMDDIIMIFPTKEQARDCLQKASTFLKERLNLETNAKTKIFPLRQGVNAFGFKIWTTHRLVRDQSKRAMKRRMRAMDRKLKNNEIELKRIEQAVNSWLGHARHSNSYNLCKRIFAKYPYIKLEGENQFGSRILGFS
ncbi:reverse transcriptase domain-containing protein [Paenibacillus sp. M1]|uniref:Reverse transcriptase domain-containing protein n=1 Tax=Paenibacillus haidiansis TaxID=1574488 RepID=A0ABU7VPN6_9BACL